MNKEINIKVLAKEDIVAAADILKDSKLCLQKDLDDRIRYLLSNKNNVSFTASVEEGIVGVLLATYNGFYVFLSHICIKKEYQKQGVGEKLHNELIEKAKELNAEGIIADSWLTATPFFHKLGYRAPGAVFLIQMI